MPTPGEMLPWETDLGGDELLDQQQGKPLEDAWSFVIGGPKRPARTGDFIPWQVPDDVETMPIGEAVDQADDPELIGSRVGSIATGVGGFAGTIGGSFGAGLLKGLARSPVVVAGFLALVGVALAPSLIKAADDDGGN